jgi:putative PIN family toxin of toxin-antitoxin system
VPGLKTDRLVIDTNVVISVFLKRNYRFLVDLKYRYQSTLYTCPEQIIELQKVHKYSGIKEKLTETAGFYTDFFRDFSTEIEIDRRFDRAADPDDNYLFDLAYSVKAFYLVTGEKALLNMKQVNKIKIITLRELIAQLEH